MAELKELQDFSETLDVLRQPFKNSPVPTLMFLATEVGGQIYIQNKHAFIGEQQYRAGESPGFRDHFTPLYPRLPDVKNPTRVSIILMEDGMMDSLTDPTHGPCAAASCSAAWQAMTGDPHMPGVAFNRMPYSDSLGYKRQGMLGPKIPERYQADFAMPVMQAWSRSSSYQVFSTSTRHYDQSLTSYTERMAANKKLDEFYGKNAILLCSNGNDRDTIPQLRHTAISFHPSSLLVGACQSLPVSVGEGAEKKDFRVIHQEAYSSYAPDILWETNPTQATYLKSFTVTPKEYQVMDGTSFSSPQAAAIVARFVQRYAKSKENPDAVLEKEDILLALRQTARPVHVREYNASHTTPVSSRELLALHRVGNHYVSEEGGCGCVDLLALDAYLQEMENAVKDGKAKVLGRETIEKQVAIPADIKPDKKFQYYYPVEMDGDNITDTIVLDVKSKDLSNSWPGMSRHKIFLADPNGGLLELMPSLHTPKEYLVAKASGFHGVPVKGKWQIITTEKIEEAHITFQNTMPPEHVSVVIQPDEQAQFTNLYKGADLREVHVRDLLSRMMIQNETGVPMMAMHDFSETAFPPYFLELSIAKLAADEKTRPHAKALVENSGVHLGARKQQYLDAIGKGDVKTLVAMIAPDDSSKTDFMDEVLYKYKDPEVVTLLMDNGYAEYKNNIGTPLIIRLTQVADRDGDWERYDSIQMLKAGVASLQKQHISVLQTDIRDKNLLEYASQRDVRDVVDKAVDHEKQQLYAAFGSMVDGVRGVMPEKIRHVMPSMEQIEQKIKALGLDKLAEKAKPIAPPPPAEGEVKPPVIIFFPADPFLNEPRPFIDDLMPIAPPPPPEDDLPIRLPPIKLPPAPAPPLEDEFIPILPPINIPLAPAPPPPSKKSRKR